MGDKKSICHRLLPDIRHLCLCLCSAKKHVQYNVQCTVYSALLVVPCAQDLMKCVQQSVLRPGRDERFTFYFRQKLRSLDRTKSFTPSPPPASQLNTALPHCLVKCILERDAMKIVIPRNAMQCKFVLQYYNVM